MNLSTNIPNISKLGDAPYDYIAIITNDKAILLSKESLQKPEIKTIVKQIVDLKSQKIISPEQYYSRELITPS